MRAAAATSTGSPARPARRASRATASRSTSSRACARRAPRRRRGAQRRLQLAAARTSGTSPPTAPTAASRGPWTKAIAVLTERNWLRPSGQVHGAGDHGPNPVGRDRDADRRPARRRARGSRAMMRAARRACARSGSAMRAVPPAQAAAALPRRWSGPSTARSSAASPTSRTRCAARSCMVGDVSRVALLIDLSLPALQRRVDAGDALQPAWGRFLERLGALRPAGAAARAPPAHAPARWRRSSSPTGADRSKAASCR